jgi:hypothetical protein
VHACLLALLSCLIWHADITQHWNLYNDTVPEPTAVYLDGYINEWLDQYPLFTFSLSLSISSLFSDLLRSAFSNFGRPCVDCGTYYNSSSLPHGSQVGGYDGKTELKPL